MLAAKTLDDIFDDSPAIVGDELFLKDKTYFYYIAKPCEKKMTSKKLHIRAAGNKDRMISKFDAQLLPRNQDIFLGIKTNMAKHFPVLAVVKNLSRDCSYPVLRTCCSVFPHVNILYLKFPRALRPQLV